MRSINKDELHSIFREIANKEEKAFEGFYEKYNKLVYAISFSILKNKENSEDIVQSVFTKIWNMDKEYLPTNSEATWLYKLTKNETLNFLRKQKDIVNIDEIYYISNEDKNLNEVIGKDSYNKILSRLEQGEQEIVSLKVLSNLSFKEISQILNIPMGTVQWKYYKALHTLKTLIGNLSMFIVTMTMFVIQKVARRKRKSANIEENMIEENVGIEKMPEKVEGAIIADEEKSEVEIEKNETSNEIIEEITIEMDNSVNLNLVDIGMLSFSGVFLVITIIFSIIFINHQQKRREKVSK